MPDSCKFEFHPDRNSAAGRMWPGGRLAEALAADLRSLVAFLGEMADRYPNAHLERILDAPDGVERNRSSIRAWRDATRTCGKCPGLRVCGSTDRGNPWPRLCAVQSVDVMEAGRGPVLALRWDVCGLGHSATINPSLAQAADGESRMWVRNPSGAEWSSRGVSLTSERPRKEWQRR